MGVNIASAVGIDVDVPTNAPQCLDLLLRLDLETLKEKRSFEP